MLVPVAQVARAVLVVRAVLTVRQAQQEQPETQVLQAATETILMAVAEAAVVAVLPGEQQACLYEAYQMSPGA